MSDDKKPLFDEESVRRIIDSIKKPSLCRTFADVPGTDYFYKDAPRFPEEDRLSTPGQTTPPLPTVKTFPDGIMRKWITNAQGKGALQLSCGVVRDVFGSDDKFYPGAVIEEPTGREHYTEQQQAAWTNETGGSYATVEENKRGGGVGIWGPLESADPS
ncbi:MAG: hypothetical protein KDI46_03585 [Alphaproteobacteria bacterium]|nr:hypothetical protein [Alphaproteobacteria bacterium]